MPAGWLISSADDLGRFVAANVNGGSLGGRRILSRAGIEQMHNGTVKAFAGPTAWAGSTAGWKHPGRQSLRLNDRHGLRDLLRARTTDGLVVLFNGQSVVYELLHKPEAIAEAAFARMIGESPGGTLVWLYPIFTMATVLLLGFLLRSLTRVMRAAARGEPVVRPVRGRRWLGAALTIWGRLILPVLVLWTAPATLAAPWEVLVQIDLGQVLAAYATLQLLTFSVVVATVVARQARRLGGPAPEPLLEAGRLTG